MKLSEGDSSIDVAVSNNFIAVSDAEKILIFDSKFGHFITLLEIPVLSRGRSRGSAVMDFVGERLVIFRTSWDFPLGADYYPLLSSHQN